MARSSLSAGLVLLTSLLACSEPDPAPSPAKAVRAVTSTSLSGVVGKPVGGGVTVKIVDYADRPKADTKVGFTILAGDGSLSKYLVVTDADGLAHVDWTLGETAGTNQIHVSVFGVDPDSNATFVADGIPDVPVGLLVTPRIARIPSTTTTTAVVARVVDQFGNVIASTPTYTSRNTSVVTVESNTGVVTGNSSNRGTSTWIDVSANGFVDSARVFNLSASDSPCTGITAMAALAIGEVKLNGFVDNGICIPAAAGDREYALVPFYNSPVPSALTLFTVTGVGVRGPLSPDLSALNRRATLALGPSVTGPAEAGILLDRRLRLAERREMARRAPDARQWYASRLVAGPRRATRALGVPAVGSEVQYNVNAIEFCASPSMRTGRIVAVTNKAIVVADKSNPANGLTDAQYASLGASFDTLAYVSDVENFGAPTDIDENGGRVVLFFTHAVNQLGAGTLGFAYSRDLLPKSGPLGSCPGSNESELINIYVPSSSVSTAEVMANAVGTMAHELQHVINSARRLYINPNAAPVEERWLNEGLSHVAEELLFYRSTKLAPRQNIGAQAILPAYQGAFINFQYQNFVRYLRFTKNPGTEGPIGTNDEDDDLETRGAVWSFLRYAADQRHAANEGAFWRGLVDANSTGLQSLYALIGADTRLVIRDWALSNFLDDLVPTDPEYQQPSWNLRALAGYQPPVVFNLLSPEQTAPTTTTAMPTLAALSSEFIRFGVGNNLEAFISARGAPVGANTPLPRNMLLGIVRVK